jgi:HK97 family phage major capsid protein
MSTETIDKELLEELKSTWEGAFKPHVDRLDEETKKHGVALGETQASIEKVQDHLDEIEAKLTRAALEDRSAGLPELDKYVKSFWHFAARGETPTPERHAEFVEAFWEWTRHGDKITPQMQASLAVSDDTKAGFLAPPEFMAEMLKGVVEFSPIRSIVRVIPTGAPSVKFPKRTGTFAAVWVSDTGTKSETQGLGVGIEDIPTHELYALVDVHNWLLEDSLFDIEAWIREEAAEQFGVAEGAAFVNGNGVGKPEGFLQHSGVTGVTSGTNDVLSADDIINLYFEPKTAYATNGTWVMARSTIRATRKLKDSQNQYLWQPGLAGVAPATIMDRPYVEAPDMPAIADASKPIAFGDFRRGYVAVDRIVAEVQRDPFTQNTLGMVRFIIRRRQGGQVVVPEAIKTLTIA